MVLTQTQKNQLHKDLLEYLANNEFVKTAEVFAMETDLQLEAIDPEGKKL